MEQSSPPSSPVSSLSSLESDDFPIETYTPGRKASIDDTASHLELSEAQPPSKRRRVAALPYNPLRDPHNFGTLTNAPFQPADDGLTDVSSDTTGSVPGSPSAKQPGGPIPDEEMLGLEQMRVCSWHGCDIGELENMDELVRHVYDQHIGDMQGVRVPCQWGECKAKTKAALMTAYALRAHMRSHTKEKPFYCALPECDRAFTRSDALAKHMRTVHEIDSLRIAEHQAKPRRGGSAHGSATPPLDIPPIVTKAPKSLKLVFGSSKQSSSTNTDPTTANGTTANDEAILSDTPLSPSSLATLLGPLPVSLAFTPAELTLPRRDLFRLLRRQMHWAEQESTALAQTLQDGECRRRDAWLAKELVLENVLEAEYKRAKRAGTLSAAEKLSDDKQKANVKAVHLAGDAAGDGAARSTAAARTRHKRVRSATLRKRMLQDVAFAEALPLSGMAMPWYRGGDGGGAGRLALDGAHDDDDDEEGGVVVVVDDDDDVEEEDEQTPSDSPGHLRAGDVEETGSMRGGSAGAAGRRRTSPGADGTEDDDDDDDDGDEDDDDEDGDGDGDEEGEGEGEEEVEEEAE